MWNLRKVVIRVGEMFPDGSAKTTDQNGTSAFSFDSGTAGEAATVEVVRFGNDGTFEAEETFVLPDLPLRSICRRYLQYGLPLRRE